MSQPAINPTIAGAHPSADAPVRGLRNLTGNDVVLWLLVAIVAWAPFPLGSNRPWSAMIVVLLVASLWAIWLAANWNQMGTVLRYARPVRVPLFLAMMALAWGVVQVLPFVPPGWAHPIWSIASDGLKQKLQATISLDPWRTEAEVMKLAAYGMAAWMAYFLSRDAIRARRLFLALIVVGSVYVLYAWLFGLLDWHQFQLFYFAPNVGNRVAAPFVNRNTLATFSGLITLCCGLKLIEQGQRAVILERGKRHFALSLVEFAFGSGVTILVATVLSFSLVIATGSLGGTIATVSAIVAVAAVSLSARIRERLDRATAITMAILATSLIALVVLSGSELAERLSEMASTGSVSEDLRVSLWSATERMIHDAPLLGLGLGTFEKAYPLYAQGMFPFVMDRAHNDFLELAAGWGLPAAIAWWTALGWLASICARGAFARNRDRLYPLAGFGATVLVGVHSMFDFSLQIPAVALLYSVMLGLGVAQAFSSQAR
jgi:O-antigen ligase